MGKHYKVLDLIISSIFPHLKPHFLGLISKLLVGLSLSGPSRSKFFLSIVGGFVFFFLSITVQIFIYNNIRSKV